MIKTTANITPTLVKFLIGLSLLTSSSVNAVEPSKTDAQVACENAPDKVKCMINYTKAASDNDSASDPCGTEANRLYKEAKKELAEACSKAGFDGRCSEQVLECSESMGSQDFNTMGVLGQVTGIPLAGLGTSSCPQLSGKDYFSRKKEIDSELKDTNSDLADLGKEKADIEKDFNTEMQDVQKEIRDAQKELADEKLKINEEKRQQISDFSKQQSETRNEVRKKNMDLLQLRGKLIKSDRDKVTKMMQLSEASSKRACMGAVKDLRDKLLKPGERVSISTARSAKSELTAAFDDCMKTFDQQRSAMNETYRQEQAELNETIGQVQSDIDDMENQLKLATTQLAEMEADAKKRGETAEQNVVKMMQEAQQKMLSAQENMKKNITALSNKETTLKQRLASLNNELMMLGPVPADQSSEDSPKKAMGSVQNETETIEDFEASCGTPSERIKSKRKLKGSSSGTR